MVTHETGLCLGSAGGTGATHAPPLNTQYRVLPTHASHVNLHCCETEIVLRIDTDHSIKHDARENH